MAGSMGTSVRIQFSRDMDASTFRGHIRVHAGDGRSLEFTTQYMPGTRVLELKFTKPLERFRTIHIDLTDEILGTDKQPLKPWTLSFDLGGA